MEHALSKLSADYPELCGKVRFWHYHPKGKGNGEPELDMGDAQLVEMCKQFAKIRQPQRMIFISDADNPNVTKSLTVNGSTFKKWGNNVYSFQIPNSEVRQNFSKVCIEHYYTDEVLKTEIEVNGIKRRLFLSHEFNKRTGLTADGVYSYEYHVKLTENGYDIIEDHVTKISDRSDHPVNYALPKNDFASEMLAGNQALANVSVEAFRKIFDVVRQIASEPIVTASVANNVSRPIRPTNS